MTQIMELIRSPPAVNESMIDVLYRDIIYCFRKIGAREKVNSIFLIILALAIKPMK